MVLYSQQSQLTISRIVNGLYGLFHLYETIPIAVQRLK